MFNERQLEAISNFGETHLRIVSNSEEILNKLDIKANPKRLQIKQYTKEHDIPDISRKEMPKSYSRPEV